MQTRPYTRTFTVDFQHSFSLYDIIFPNIFRMDQCEVRNILSEKGKRVKIIKSFKFSFQKKLAFNKERWNCTTKICKAFLKVDEND